MKVADETILDFGRRQFNVMMISLRTFWSPGAVAMMSFIKIGISSVTLCTPAPNVPSGADRLGVCPWALA